MMDIIPEELPKGESKSEIGEVYANSPDSAATTATGSRRTCEIGNRPQKQLPIYTGLTVL
jgi:beta-lactam-binding protein with PASTA domain